VLIPLRDGPPRPAMPYKTLIELDKLKQHFHEPMADVARKFGVCTTFFKRICRTYGIKRWPFRKLQSIGKKIAQLRTVDTAQSKLKLDQLQVTLDRLQSSGVGSDPSPNSKNDSSDDDSGFPVLSVPCQLSVLVGVVGEASRSSQAQSPHSTHTESDNTDSRYQTPSPDFSPPVALSLDCTDQLTQILGELAQRNSPPPAAPIDPRAAVHQSGNGLSMLSQLGHSIEKCHRQPAEQPQQRGAINATTLSMLQ